MQATEGPVVVGDPNDGRHGAAATAEASGAPHGGHDAHVEASPIASSPAASAPSASPAPAAVDEHSAGAEHDDGDDSPEAAGDGHEEGGSDAVAVEQRPREMVLGGFLTLNSLAFAGAAWLRRRDRLAAARMARRHAGSISSTTRDASR